MQLFGSPNTDTDILEEIDQDVVVTDVYRLFVFNDDVNTFDWVIETLMDVCKHSPEQAEQCALIVHNKGKCSVKDGDWEELAIMRQEICRRGISAEVI
jgi:ATP-dependent Clp protease adaptor protein ClpS